MRLITLCLAAILALAGCNRAEEPVDPAIATVDLKAGEDFLAKTAKEPGVVTLPSGLMYKVVASPNPGAPKPAVTDTVKVHYEGKLIGGSVFDSSYERGTPAVFPITRVVEGWQIGIPLMHKGDTFMLYVPPNLGYGDQAKGSDIPANSVLVFKVELLDIQGK